MTTGSKPCIKCGHWLWPVRTARGGWVLRCACTHKPVLTIVLDNTGKRSLEIIYERRTFDRPA